MKNLSWAVLGLLLCVPFTGAETIDSVSFNPARLGRYETLKVSDQLTTKGGIEANAVTVQSGGTVSVNNAGNYKFPATEVKGSVEMTSTDFKADTLNSRGTASFENKSSSAQSKISTLNTSTADVRANILDLTSVTVPTGGSLTLGENAIPEPTQSCSNLRWVERTTDDNYKYKVLAFGACADGDDDCKDSYGPWITFTGSKTDTCNGRTSAMYICSGTEKSCVDVYITSSGSGNNYGTPTSASYTTTDTCDGDIYNRFMGTPSGTSCVDVYADMTGSRVVTNSLCISYCGRYSTDFWPTTCGTGVASSGSGNQSSNAQYVASYGIEAFCRDKIFSDSRNPNKTSCRGHFIQTDPSMAGTPSCRCPQTGGLYYMWYECKAAYYQRTVTKGSSESKKYRNVTCCEGGGALSGGGIIQGTLKPSN